MRHLRIKRLLSSSLSLLSLCVLSACSLFARDIPQTCPPVKIGVILAANTPEGLEQRLAYDFAQSELTIHGCPFELLYEDEGDITDRESAQVAALELSEQDVIAILGGTSQQATMRIAGVARYLEIPLLSPLEGSNELAEQNNPYVFQISPPQSAAAQASFSLLANSLGVQGKVAILYEQSEFGESAAVSAGKAALEQGLEIVAYQGYATTSPDVPALLLAMQSTGPAAIYLISSNPELASSMWLTLKSNLTTLRYFIGHGYGFIGQNFLYTPAFQLNPEMKGLIFTSAWNRDIPGIDLAAFELKFRTYRQTINRDENGPLTVRTVQSYATVHLLTDALNSVPLDNAMLADLPGIRRLLIETLRNLTSPRSLDSLIGPITFGPGGQNRAEQLLVQVMDGQLFTVYPPLYASRQPEPLTP